MNKKMVGMKRAEYSFLAMKAFDKDKDKMKSYIKKMPMLIKSNGLGQTLAFYLSKRAEHTMILDILADYFNKEDILKCAGAPTFVQKVITLDADDYRLVTNETLLYLDWLRRFAEGLL